MSMETVPTELRHLRACLVCSLVKTLGQFERDGCENCNEFLHMKNSNDTAMDYTSSSFDGLIALMSPEDSWVAKWQRLTPYVKGCYAISVTGKLSTSMLNDLKLKGIAYRSRDTSTTLTK